MATQRTVLARSADRELVAERTLDDDDGTAGAWQITVVEARGATFIASGLLLAAALRLVEVLDHPALATHRVDVEVATR